ncbi:MAG: PDGLE domain-containing protein [Phycicoccus sp.]|nr:PDGLE domain-containing protein [Phycicoccus sp.]
MTAHTTTRRPSLRGVLLVGGLVCLALAGIVSAWASSSPDGLEYVAGQLGFEQAATTHATESSPIAGYAVRGLGDGPLATGLAGLIGVGVVTLIMALLLRWLARHPAAD